MTTTTSTTSTTLYTTTPAMSTAPITKNDSSKTGADNTSANRTDATGAVPNPTVDNSPSSANRTSATGAVPNTTVDNSPNVSGGDSTAIATTSNPSTDGAYEVTGMVKMSVSNCTELKTEDGRSAIGKALANASAVEESWVNVTKVQCARRLADRQLRFLAETQASIGYRIHIPRDAGGAATAAQVKNNIEQETAATLSHKLFAELTVVGLSTVLTVSEITQPTVNVVTTITTAPTTTTEATTTQSTEAAGKGQVGDDADTGSGGGGGGDAGAIIGIVVAILAGIILLAGLPVCVICRRKMQYERRMQGVRDLELTAENFDNQVKEFINQIDIYEGKYKKAEQQQDSAVLNAKETHIKYMEVWQRLEQEVQDFFLQVYTPEFEARQAQNGGSSLEKSASGSMRPQATSTYWPPLPVTSEVEVKRQCMQLEVLSKNLDATTESFRKLVESAFPMGIAELPTPGFLRNTTYVPESPDVERDAELLRPLAHPLLAKIVIKPHGVLGIDEGKAKVEPRSKISAVVVDPAGWAFISKAGNAKGAAGASGAIYDWLGLRSAGASGKFPMEVLNHFKAAQEEDAETLAKWHRYEDGMDVIHTIGPKIMDVYKSLPELTRTYVNVLDEFCKFIDSAARSGPASNAPPQHLLRLLPVSSGIFLRNKKLEKHMPQLTWTALSLAFGALPSAQQEQLRTSVIEVCIFEKNKVPLYEQSLQDKLKLVPGSTLKLDNKQGAVPDKRGFDWVRTKNGPEDRMHRLACFLSTASALHHRSYTLADGRAVTLSMDAMLKDTKLLRASVLGHLKTATASHRKTVRHEDMTVMEAAIFQQSAGKRTLAVNAASAYQVGGGVMSGGRHALEETWCTMSTLLPSLQVVQWKERRSSESGASGTRHMQHIPVDGCIVSPHVEVFRNMSAQGYVFREMPTQLSGVCSMAMFNMNARVSDSPCDAPQDFAEYCRQVRQKFRAVLDGVKEVNATVLVCPDVGCGVFENDPEVVGSLLGEAIREFPRDLEVVITGKPAFYDAAKSAVEAAPDDQPRENKEPVPAAFRPRPRANSDASSSIAPAKVPPPAKAAAAPPKSGAAGAPAAAPDTAVPAPPKKAESAAKAAPAPPPAKVAAAAPPKSGSAEAPAATPPEKAESAAKAGAAAAPAGAPGKAGPTSPPAAAAPAPAPAAATPASAKPASAAGKAAAKPSAKAGKGDGKRKATRS
eukprot:TRINITY_DN3491_c0_g1_i1.p1 TRINITY_DN3491_c0_g1~~TRINITY_DN3491_c0_g1_i1.p1  ORF type:complete len:1301 (-),score=273.03 TRINITY_DN3491_c0_g1_i1:80-3685(-)